MHIKLSRFLSFILRHQPQAIGMKLNEEGYVNVSELLNAINNETKFNITMNTLQEIVNEDDKNRYSFNHDKTMLRANQGHSINVNVGLIEKQPKRNLYHGTSTKYMDNIRNQGLTKGKRLYVHLSDSRLTAKEVGARHGKPVVLMINIDSMIKDGYKFYQSANKIWLTEEVPAKYIKELNV
ncbi:MAG TPA: RNA 2'-phosphotransferase [Clostridiales bacterium]|nr:RNA 2'-phosphotransferase [Clostridiales bacterium]